MPLKIASVLPVWILVLAATVTIALVTPRSELFTWFSIVLAASILLTFCVQLAIQRKEGFNGRLSLSASGSFLIIAAAALILWTAR